MDKGKISDLIALAVIVLLGLFTAYVTFGILQSQASTAVKNYSLSGAVAGALISMSMFFSVYRGFRKSSGEVEKLRDRIQELSQKVIRGAPCPRAFEIEVDERQRIVLAKPQKWEPRGGTIFDFELSKEKLQEKDIFPARFTVTYVPITPDLGSMDEFYDRMHKSLDSPTIGSWTSEYINIGGEPNPIGSLKVIAQVYVKATVVKNAVTGKLETSKEQLSKEDFEALKTAETKGDQGAPPSSPQTAETKGDQGGPPSSPHKENTESTQPTQAGPSSSALIERVDYLRVWQMYVACWHEDLNKVFVFEFWDDEQDFTKSSAMFNQILDSVRFLT